MLALHWGGESFLLYIYNYIYIYIYIYIYTHIYSIYLHYALFLSFSLFFCCTISVFPKTPPPENRNLTGPTCRFSSACGKTVDWRGVGWFECSIYTPKWIFQSVFTRPGFNLRPKSEKKPRIPCSSIVFSGPSITCLAAGGSSATSCMEKCF